MVPAWTRPLPSQAYAAARQAIDDRPELAAVRRALWRASEGSGSPIDLSDCRDRDPDNGLYGYLDLAARLRGPDGSAPSEDPSSDEKVRAALSSLRHGPPARLHLIRQRVSVETVLLKAGVSPRRSALEANPTRFVLGGVRQLTQRLTAQGDSWRRSGRPDDARLAYAAVVRLLTDLVEDSPTPDAALLAAEGLPSALRGMGAEDEARKVEAFRNCWHGIDPDAGVNLLPNTGDVLLARAAHDRVLGPLVASAAAAGAWVTSALTSLALLVVVAVTRPPADVSPRWRWGWRGMLLAAAIVALPLIGVFAIVAVAEIPFAWLISYPSWPAVFLLAVVPAAVGLATRACVEPAGDSRGALIPPVAVWTMASIIVLTALAISTVLPVQPEPWRPPPGIQRFRQLAWAVGAECVAAIVVWMIWGMVRRRRSGLPYGTWARANLAVAALGLLVVSVLSLAALGVNRYYDSRHQHAFARAAADPIADRLGATWWQEHFAPARAAADLSGRARDSLGGDSQAGWHGLTPEDMGLAKGTFAETHATRHPPQVSRTLSGSASP